MKTINDIRSKELEMSKNYSIKEIKMSIVFYKIFRFLFSKKFSFILSLAVFTFVASLFNFSIISCIVLLIGHPIYFFYVDDILNKLSKSDSHFNELSVLIDVNYEILEEKRRV